MSLIKVYQGFYNQLTTLSDIDIVNEGQEYTPDADTPYLEFYLKPAIDNNIFINETGYKSKGFVQFSLYYPTSDGIGAILTKVEEIKTLFKSKFSFIQDDIKISILRDLEVVNLGVVGDRLVYAIRVNYQGFIK